MKLSKHYRASLFSEFILQVGSLIIHVEGTGPGGLISFDQYLVLRSHIVHQAQCLVHRYSIAVWTD